MPEWLKDWWPVIALVTPMAILAAGWVIRMGLASKTDLRNHADKQAEAMEKHDLRLAEIDRRLDRGEGRFERISLLLGQMPTKDDVHALALGIERISAGQGAIEAKVEGVRSQVNKTEERVAMMDDYLRQDALLDKQRTS